MFNRLTDRRLGAAVAITIDGEPCIAFEADTVASAMLATGHSIFRSTPVSAIPRGPFCMMGACFDYLVWIDGRPNQQACLLRVAAHMCVECSSALLGSPR